MSPKCIGVIPALWKLTKGTAIHRTPTATKIEQNVKSLTIPNFDKAFWGGFEMRTSVQGGEERSSKML